MIITKQPDGNKIVEFPTRSHRFTANLNLARGTIYSHDSLDPIWLYVNSENEAKSIIPRAIKIGVHPARYAQLFGTSGSLLNSFNYGKFPPTT